tara:strand:+ start:518 stop:763 length:246 start_codon:yes stop_codon:yes gene_type:complete
MFNTRALVPLLENVRVAVYALDEMQEQLNEAAAYKLELDEWRDLAENMAGVLYHMDDHKKTNSAFNHCIHLFQELSERYPV